MSSFLNIGRSLEKVDALSLATGEEFFADDYRFESLLHLAILYSPYPHARIKKVDVSMAQEIKGVVDILWYENVPRILHTTAGQGFPEPSPYDTVLFDNRVRFVGDRVALVAAESLEIAREAAKQIMVEYEVLPAVFDAIEAMEPDAPKIHDADEHAVINTPYEPHRNICAKVNIGFGDIETGFSEADFIEEHVYNTHFANHCAIEPHAAISFFDRRGRLVIISTTQVPFHARRIVSMVLQIPVGMIRVIKPRIGGGFGAKQEVFLEPLVGLITLKHKRPARLVLERSEVFVSSRARNAMTIELKTGIKNDGTITALKMKAIMNTGAYGTHALTVLSNAGSKVLPLFNKIKNLRFEGTSVYTNNIIGGAYRGYGATQGYFAFNQQIDIIARKLGVDVLEYIKKWHIKEGETSEIFRILGEGREGVGQVIRSCKLSKCIDIGAKEIDWYSKRDKHIHIGNDMVKGVGVAVAMQGSGIPRIDMGSAYMKMNEDGSFNLHVGATDIGTGSDTILAQIAAEVLQIPHDKIIVRSSDTDLTPFDVGAYASSTTYVSGGAVKKCADEIRKQILNVAAQILEAEAGELSMNRAFVVDEKTGKKASFEEIARYALYSHDQFQIQATASHYGTESPPPFVAQFAEVDVDVKTGKVYVKKFVSVVDCGQPINPKLVEGQIEGAALNGICFALTEQYLFDTNGRVTNDSFWDYKIYVAADKPELRTIIVDSYEESGPFGAKSVAEIAINGPAPAIANAIYDAVGIRIFDLPITQEKLWRLLRQSESKNA